jgi:cytochrome c oxidase cbb3-type subunit 3
MKFKNYLETITGVEIYPLISLLIFFLFFVGCIIYVIKADNNKMEKNKNIPLED